MPRRTHGLFFVHSVDKRPNAFGTHHMSQRRARAAAREHSASEPTLVLERDYWESGKRIPDEKAAMHGTFESMIGHVNAMAPR